MIYGEIEDDFAFQHEQDVINERERLDSKEEENKYGATYSDRDRTSNAAGTYIQDGSQRTKEKHHIEKNDAGTIQSDLVAAMARIKYEESDAKRQEKTASDILDIVQQKDFARPGYLNPTLMVCAYIVKKQGLTADKLRIFSKEKGIKPYNILRYIRYMFSS